MYNKEFVDSLNSLLSDSSFVEKLSEVETVEEITTLFAERGLTVEDTDLEQILVGIRKYADNDELSEDMLEDVSGGFAISGLICAGAMIGSAIVVGYVVWKVGKWIIDRRNAGKCG